MIFKKLIPLFFLFNTFVIHAQISVGQGSYSTSFPGVDAAGRNSYPSGTPYVSGWAKDQPIPTNDWWSKLVKEGSADNLFNYPFTMKTLSDGLIVSYIPWGVIGDSAPIKVGLTGLNTSSTTISNYSDWTVTMDWTDSSKQMQVTSGVGMPFLYFTKSPQDKVSITVDSGTVTTDGSRLIIENASHGADFVVFAPNGSNWNKSGTTYTSNLNGQNYWSMAMIAPSESNLTASVNELQEFAFVFPTNTTVAWSYDEATSKVTSTYSIETEVKEGNHSTFYQGMLPHQWAHLASTSPQPSGPSYTTVRGEMKILKGSSFSLENTFNGILPTLPNRPHYSDTFDISLLTSKVRDLQNSKLDTWTDSYNEGQLMNRLIQTARIADEIQLFDARDQLIATIKERLEDWLTYSSGEVAFLFYYQPQWTSLIGYPAGHGQDSNINDHHFHWGYFIHAAAFMEQFEPGWLSQWGGMIDLLIRDAATADRDDDLFPFLRNFSPYAGHSWANGFASFPQGNDQESTSESMQFNSSLIHYGSITGNDAIRDLGIFLYTTEQSAIEEYWFDIHERNFGSNQQYGLVSRVWGNSYDNGTFWTSDITASYGIEFYPIHGGSYYLASNSSYTQKIWNEIEQYTDILNPNATNPNLWYDTFWKYLAFINPEKALDLYNQAPNRNLKFGISDAQTYYWLHASNALGVVRTDLTADEPLAMAFEKNSKITYVAHNYSSVNKKVTFSDGYELLALAGQMTTSEDLEVSGELSTNYNEAYANNTISLQLNTTSPLITKVEFYSGSTLLSSDEQAPFEYVTEPLSLGPHSFYTRMYIDSKFELSNAVKVNVGEQVPYQGHLHQIPGTINSGHYDEFEGGSAQNISYVDLSTGNHGDHRLNESVDASLNTNEGPTVGWIEPGEWLEYTVEIQQTGFYTLDFRYSSANTSGGGPFHLLVDGKKVTEDIAVDPTSDSNWSVFKTATVANIPLVKGKRIMRIQFTRGELNLGSFNFTYTRPLDYEVPIANAGENKSVILPAATSQLDGSQTEYLGSESLSYQWTQVYGPTVVTFEEATAKSTQVSNLAKGVYKFQLEVSNGFDSDSDQVMIAVNETGNQPPAIAISSPQTNSDVREGTSILINTRTSDLDGTVAQVKFYVNAALVAEVNQAPFNYEWTPPQVGSYSLTAVAYDDKGLSTESTAVVVHIQSVKQCISSGEQAQQGSFSIGYRSIFETVGNSVTITFEILDTDKSGLIAYLWQESPFQEFELEQLSERVFSKTISGFDQGEIIRFAAKFAYAGGLSVTPYVEYVVGSDCSAQTDLEAPTNFSASLNSIAAIAVNFDLYAEDNSGAVIYSITQNNDERVFSGVSAQTTTVAYSGLQPETNYEFSVAVSDANGNKAETIKTFSVLTSASTNTDCSGESNLAQQGSFDQGYTYRFETQGSNVIVEFKLLDDRPDLVAYLWKESPFAELPMSSVSENTFRAVLTNQVIGQSISYGVKFAFAGGLAVTKYFQYVVGDNCISIDDEDQDGVADEFDLCPNTPQGTIVDFNGCELFNLPQDNYSVEVTSATCVDTSNGAITISAQAHQYTYNVTVSGQDSLTLSTDNEHSSTLSNLPAGTYEICFTVAGVDNYQQCYSVQIGEPQPLSASSKVNYSSRTVNLSMSGSELYTVTVNGKSMVTADSSINVDLKAGMNTIEITTDLDCQGSYFEEIFVSEEVLAYPNPTRDWVQLYVGGVDSTTTMILTDVSGYQYFVKEVAIPQNRVIELNLSDYPTGMYFIRLGGSTVQSNLKVIKE